MSAADDDLFTRATEQGSREVALLLDATEDPEVQAAAERLSEGVCELVALLRARGLQEHGIPAVIAGAAATATHIALRLVK